MTEQKRPKAYSYVRFSTPEQERGDSFRRQTALARVYADANGLDLDESLTLHDLGVSAYSGANVRTGALGQFLRAADAGDVEAGSFLLVENLDRVSRADPWEALPVFQQIINAGVTIVTLKDGRTYSKELMRAEPMRILESLFVMIRSNEESASKSQRLRAAWGQKKALAASEKRPMTRRLPAWLTLSADGTTIEVIDERADVVRRVFREAAAGSGQHRIARGLAAAGIEPFGDGKRRAAVWSRSYVQKLLSNPAVIGTMTPHTTRTVAGKRVRDAMEPIPGYFPAIVSKAAFSRLNKPSLARSMPKMNGTTGQVSNVLAGLARCPQCGSTMTRVNKGRKGGTPYLVCVNAKAGGGCQYRQVKLGAVEEAVRGAAGVFARDIPHPNEKLDNERTSFVAQQEGVQDAIDRIVEEVEAGNASRALRDRLSDLERALLDIEASIADVEERAEASGGRAVSRRLAKLTAALEAPRSTPTTVNAALREAFSACTVDYLTGMLAFEWRQGGEPTSIPYAWPEDAA